MRIADEEPTDASPLPSDPDGALVATVLARLLQEPNPITRWNAITALAERRLNWVRQLTVAQLRAEGLSMAQVAQKIGVSKARVQQLDAGRSGGPDYAWGRQLAAAERLAYLADHRGGDPRQGGRNYLYGECSKLVEQGLATATIRSRLAEAARRWARVAASAGNHADAASEALGRYQELDAESAGLGGYLTMDERAQVVLGYHHERPAASAHERRITTP